MITWLFGYTAFVIALTLAVRRFRPGWSRAKRIMAVALPGPVAILIGGIGVAAYIFLQPTPSGEIDAGGMAMMVMTIGAAFAAVFALAIGLTVAAVAETIGR